LTIWQASYHNIGSATVAGTVVDTFQPIFMPQQTPLGTSQYSTSPLYPSRQVMDESYGTSLSQGTIQKIQELKRLVNKYPKYCHDGLLQWIVISCTNVDDTLLDNKLEQLRTIDRRLNGWS
jgi:hypothetical protein